ncbi:hypothetical protein HDU96_008354 [Phlyctochytrium bullatum]|nr:hypothetical protein HDU96_008354 [Phlyctochytrium bullatum]
MKGESMAPSLARRNLDDGKMRRSPKPWVWSARQPGAAASPSPKSSSSSQTSSSPKSANDIVSQSESLEDLINLPDPSSSSSAATTNNLLETPLRANQCLKILRTNRMTVLDGTVRTPGGGVVISASQGAPATRASCRKACSARSMPFFGMVMTPAPISSSKSSSQAAKKQKMVCICVSDSATVLRSAKGSCTQCPPSTDDEAGANPMCGSSTATDDFGVNLFVQSTRLDTRAPAAPGSDGGSIGGMSNSVEPAIPADPNIPLNTVAPASVPPVVPVVASPSSAPAPSPSSSPLERIPSQSPAPAAPPNAASPPLKPTVSPGSWSNQLNNGTLDSTTSENAESGATPASGLSSFTLVLIGVGMLVLLGCVVGLIVWGCRKRRRRDQSAIFKEGSSRPLFGRRKSRLDLHPSYGINYTRMDDSSIISDEPLSHTGHRGAVKNRSGKSAGWLSKWQAPFGKSSTGFYSDKARGLKGSDEYVSFGALDSVGVPYARVDTGGSIPTVSSSSTGKVSQDADMGSQNSFSKSPFSLSALRAASIADNVSPPQSGSPHSMGKNGLIVPIGSRSSSFISLSGPIALPLPPSLPESDYLAGSPVAWSPEWDVASAKTTATPVPLSRNSTHARSDLSSQTPGSNSARRLTGALPHLPFHPQSTYSLPRSDSVASSSLSLQPPSLALVSGGAAAPRAMALPPRTSFRQLGMPQKGPRTSFSVFDEEDEGRSAVSHADALGVGVPSVATGAQSVISPTNTVVPEREGALRVDGKYEGTASPAETIVPPFRQSVGGL